MVRIIEAHAELLNSNSAYIIHKGTAYTSFGFLQGLAFSESHVSCLRSQVLELQPWQRTSNGMQGFHFQKGPLLLRNCISLNVLPRCLSVLFFCYGCYANMFIMMCVMPTKTLNPKPLGVTTRRVVDASSRMRYGSWPQRMSCLVMCISQLPAEM